MQVQLEDEFDFVVQSLLQQLKAVNAKKYLLDSFVKLCKARLSTVVINDELRRGMKEDVNNLFEMNDNQRDRVFKEIEMLCLFFASVQ